MLPLIEEHIEEIAQLCQQYGARKLELFGSACRGEFDPETSDLDFVAEFVERQSPGYLDCFLNFADAVEALMGRKIDLVTSTSRNLAKLGEALNHAAEMDDNLETTLPALRSVVGMRNRIIHGYRTIDNEIVWNAASLRTPELQQQIDSMLVVDPASE